MARASTCTRRLIDGSAPIYGLTLILPSDIVTTTVTTPQTSPRSLIQIQDPYSSFNGYYAFLDSTSAVDRRPIQVTANRADAQEFFVNGNKQLYSNGFLEVQNVEKYFNNPSYNAFFRAPFEDLTTGPGPFAQPYCDDSATGLLVCTEAPQGSRNVMSICDSTAGLGTTYVDASYLVLDTDIHDGCEEALLFVTIV